MGNTSTKLAEKCTLLSKDEVPVVAGSFKFVSKNSDRIKEDDLMKIWGSQMDARLAQYIANFLFGPPGGSGAHSGNGDGGGGGGGSAGRQPYAGFQRFAELYVFCVRGTLDDRLEVITASLRKEGGGSASGATTTGAGSGAGAAGTSAVANGAAAGLDGGAGEAEYSYPLVKEFVEAVVSSYVRSVKLQGGPEYKSWESRGFHFVHECIQKLAESLSYELATIDTTQKVSPKDIESWLSRTPTFLCMLSHVFLHLFQYRSAKSSQHQLPGGGGGGGLTGGGGGGGGIAQHSPQPQSHQQHQTQSSQLPADQLDAVAASRRPASLLPVCDGLHYTPDFPACTDISQIMFINAALPQSMRHKWRFLFTGHMHGESFSTLLGRIMDQGPSVLIVEDTDGCIFGGYATRSWSMSPKFVGDEEGFLFTLRPRMRVFPSTGYNGNYQYLNLHQQTLPNGLGMGGQHNYWGLWLDCEYGRGQCSETCSTYRNYTQLSAKKEFRIRNVEVWGVGEKPVKEDSGSPERSVLDGNVEEKALLQLAGREQHSDGYRDEPKD